MEELVNAVNRIAESSNSVLPLWASIVDYFDGSYNHYFHPHGSAK